MARERSSVVLILVGILWLAIAVVWATQLYNPPWVRIPAILTYGLSSLIAGLFIGRVIQKIATRKAPVDKSPVE